MNQPTTRATSKHLSLVATALSLTLFGCLPEAAMSSVGSTSRQAPEGDRMADASDAAVDPGTDSSSQDSSAPNDARTWRAAADAAPLFSVGSATTPERADCGCEKGSFCSRLTAACIIPQVAMTYTFTNTCNDGGMTIKARVFDDTNGRVFPDNERSLEIPFRETETLNILCVAGSRLCMGASSGKSFWGVGIENKETCESCCRVCGRGDFWINLECQ